MVNIVLRLIVLKSFGGYHKSVTNNVIATLRVLEQSYMT